MDIPKTQYQKSTHIPPWIACWVPITHEMDMISIFYGVHNTVEFILGSDIAILCSKNKTSFISTWYVGSVSKSCSEQMCLVKFN